MPLAQDQIAHIAKLSRLSLSAEQLEAYRHTLDGIVDYMDILASVPAEKLAGLQPFFPHILPLRDDEAAASPISRESLLGVSAQKVVAGQIAVPNIMA